MHDFISPTIRHACCYVVVQQEQSVIFPITVPIVIVIASETQCIIHQVQYLLLRLTKFFTFPTFNTFPNFFFFFQKLRLKVAFFTLNFSHWEILNYVKYPNLNPNNCILLYIIKLQQCRGSSILYSGGSNEPLTSPKKKIYIYL